MSITVAELEQNLSKYIEISASEDVYITRDGNVIAKLSSPIADKMAILKSLRGCIPSDMTLEEAREERLSKI